MSKREILIDALRHDWQSTTHLMALFGWKSHTLRGVLSDLGRKQSLKIERQRVDGITSYRIAAP